MSEPVFSTFGCRLNACETEAMRKFAADAGVRNAIVVNTCAVTSEAVRKARREIRGLRRENLDARLIVTGCAAQTEPETFARMEEVDAVVGNAEKMRVATWRALSAGFPDENGKVMAGSIMSAGAVPAFPPEAGAGGRTRAYVQIQNGCDHRCTFCIIPYGRGDSRSVPADAVVDRVGRLVDKGFNEVVLTGVDLTSWGTDLPVRPRLGELVLRILRSVPDLPRLRLSSLDAVEADEDLMLAIASEPRLMPHLHLSLQAGDDMILKRMKRRHSRDDAIRFCEEARRLRSDMTYGADIIAGFPTETEAMFENSLKLVEECGLTWLHVFPYSPRPGTPAARMPQVDRSVVASRAARLRAAGRVRVDSHLARQVGRTHRVLMESSSMGRTEQFARVSFAEPRTRGAIVTAAISGIGEDRLMA